MPLAPPILALSALMTGLIKCAVGLNLASSKDLRRLTHVLREMARMTKHLNTAADMLRRDRLKARMLGNNVWRWRVICELGCYDALDRWTRRMARQSRVLRRRGYEAARLRGFVKQTKNALTFDAGMSPDADIKRKLARTDKAGQFRLAAISRASSRAGAFALKKSPAVPLVKLKALNTLAARRKTRLHPIPLTAHELDMRPPPLKKKPKINPPFRALTLKFLSAVKQDQKAELYRAVPPASGSP